MTAWSPEEIDRIGAADELELAAVRPDGTLRKPVTIWVVPHGDDLYVRSYRGTDGAWFRAAEATHRARVRAGGLEKEVALVDADDDVNDAVDEAYRTKYDRYGEDYVAPMVAEQGRATTLKLIPRSAED